MNEESENRSNVGFYLLPRTEREPTPPTPHQLMHRLSVIREVSEDSSTCSTPISSPIVKQSNSMFELYEPGHIESISYQQEIVLHTSGRGDGSSNLSSQRYH